jgi:catechol 2,3-dioxygenase-like lactoylglutathione lyase family enzyme
MEARIDIITLAAADLERALGFYRDGLGLESRGVLGTEFAGDDVEPAGAIALFELEDKPVGVIGARVDRSLQRAEGKLMITLAVVSRNDGAVLPGK